MIVALHRSDSAEEAVSLTKWYGSYLLWSEVDEADRESWRERVMVRHLRGRKMPAPNLASDSIGSEPDD